MELSLVKIIRYGFSCDKYVQSLSIYVLDVLY